MSSSPASGDAAESVRFVNKPPLYLQNQGHSRTVVGIELADDAAHLLVFDPDVDISAGANDSVEVQRLRLPHGAIQRSAQYQVLHVDNTGHDQVDIAKTISSLRIP
ncbi:hypothetical protein GQ54DRAFT_295625 [Martensiomyces pterosporus]|nr:hypothetical protein GQ54DRAFT_295625 [Martensiomyces pterosporus]